MFQERATTSDHYPCGHLSFVAAAFYFEKNKFEDLFHPGLDDLCEETHGDFFMRPSTKAGDRNDLVFLVFLCERRTEFYFELLRLCTDDAAAFFDIISNNVA